MGWIMNKLFIGMLAAVIIFACTKESNKKYCWQGFDRSGIDVTGLLVCGKTAAEVEALYPQYWFYKSTDPKYCWKAQTAQGQTIYFRNVPVSMTEKMKPYGGLTFTKMDCNSFCIWAWQEKGISKLTGFYAPTRPGVDILFGDTCTKLFVGRSIVIRETQDSVITREFIEKVP